MFLQEARTIMNAPPKVMSADGKSRKPKIAAGLSIIIEKSTSPNEITSPSNVAISKLVTFRSHLFPIYKGKLKLGVEYRFTI